DRSADLESCAGRETGDTLGRAQTKALIDFRVEPDFGALPEFDAQTQRRVPALAALVRDKTMLPHIGRAERRRILLDEGRLAVHGKRAKIKRFGSLREDLRIDAVSAEPVIQSDPHRMDREIGGATLPA